MISILSRSMRILWIVLAIPALLYLIAVVWLYLKQGDFVFYPTPDVAVTPAARGLAFEEVWLQTEDNVKLHAWFIPAKNERTTLLFCHGNGGNLSHRVESIAIFNRLGLSVLIFDYRGYGKSEGEPSEEGVYRDAEAAWRYLIETRHVAPEHVIIFGRSLGGAVATWLALRHQSRGLILESAFTSIPDLGSERYPFMPVRLLARFQFNTINRIKSINAPLLVIHSVDDETIPYSHGRRLFDAAPEPKEFLDIRGGHNDGYLLSGEVYVDGVGRWLVAGSK